MPYLTLVARFMAPRGIRFQFTIPRRHANLLSSSKPNTRARVVTLCCRRCHICVPTTALFMPLPLPYSRYVILPRDLWAINRWRAHSAQQIFVLYPLEETFNVATGCRRAEGKRRGGVCILRTCSLNFNHSLVLRQQQTYPKMSCCRRLRSHSFILVAHVTERGLGGDCPREENTRRFIQCRFG